MLKEYLYSLLIVSFFISLFSNWQGMTYLTGILAILSLLYSLPKASVIYKTMGIIFTVIGLIFLFQQGKTLVDLPFYMTSTVSLLSVMFVLPFINSAVVIGRYDRNVNKLLKERAEHLGQLYNRTSFVSFLLGSFLNIATLPLVHSVVSKNLKKKPKALMDKFIAQSMLRGYALSLSCSPIELMIILSVDITATSYLALLPMLILFVLLMFGFNILFGKKYQSTDLTSQPGNGNHSSAVTKKVIKKIASLIFYLFLFITLIITINRLTTLGFLEIVALVIGPYSLMWALSIGRIKSYLPYALTRWRRGTRGLSNFMALFLSAGFFITMLNQSFLIEYIHAPVEALTEVPLLLFICIQLLFLGLAMIGFHPLVTISILGNVLIPFLDVINPVSLALVLITSGLSTVMAGPFNISVSITGSLMGRNPYQISYWNLLFAFLFSGTGTILAWIVQLL